MIMSVGVAQLFDVVQPIKNSWRFGQSNLAALQARSKMDYWLHSLSSPVLQFRVLYLYCCRLKAVVK